MTQAIAILSSSEAKKTFEGATKSASFLQISSITTRQEVSKKAYDRIKTLATTYKDLKLAKIAVAIQTVQKTAGHFDKIISMIDTMIGMMREEEAEDIKHRDRCEAKENANQNAKDDLNAEITKMKEHMNRMKNSKADLAKAMKAVSKEIKDTKKAQDEL